MSVLAEKDSIEIVSEVLVLSSLAKLSGSPGLVVKGGDSCSDGRGFESQCCILDGSFFIFICCVKYRIDV